MGNLNRLYREFNERAQFFLVYIREAHTTDGWQVGANVRDCILFAQPKTEKERANVARTCVKNLGIEFPTLLDNMDNAVEQAYTAWPDRLYVVGKDGKIAFKSGPGPRGFDSRELGVFLDLLVGNSSGGKPPGKPAAKSQEQE